VRDGAVEGGEEFAKGVLEGSKGFVVLVEALFDARTEVVRRTPAAKGDPVIGGALSIDDGVPIVGQRSGSGENRRRARTLVTGAR